MGRREKETVSAIAGAKTRLLLLSFPGVQNVDQRNVQFVHSLGRTCHSNPNVCMNTKTHRRREKKESVRGREGERGEGMKQRKWDGRWGKSKTWMMRMQASLKEIEENYHFSLCPFHLVNSNLRSLFSMSFLANMLLYVYTEGLSGVYSSDYRLSVSGTLNLRQRNYYACAREGCSLNSSLLRALSLAFLKENEDESNWKIAVDAY